MQWMAAGESVTALDPSSTAVTARTTYCALRNTVKSVLPSSPPPPTRSSSRSLQTLSSTDHKRRRALAVCFESSRMTTGCSSCAALLTAGTVLCCPLGKR